MEDILKKRITMVSGWGVGVVILMMVFREGVNLHGYIAKFSDGLLAILVAIFFVMFSVAISLGMVGVQTRDGVHGPVRGGRKILSLLISVFMIVIGWLIMSRSEVEYAVPMAIATLGALVSAAGCVISYFAVLSIFRRGRV